MKHVHQLGTEYTTVDMNNEYDVMPQMNKQKVK